MSSEGVGATKPQATLPIRVLILDGAEPGTFAYSQLLVLQELIHRLEWEVNTEEDGSAPLLLCDYFDVISGSGMGGFFAILATVFRMTVTEMEFVHKTLCDHLFSLPTWKDPDINKEDNFIALENVLRTVLTNHAEALDSPLSQSLPRAVCRGFLCAANPQYLSQPRVFSTHPSRTRAINCSVLEALLLSLSDSFHLPAVVLGGAEFIGAAHPWSNPTEATMSHMALSFRHPPSVASIMSIGFHTGQSLTLDQPGRVPIDCEAQADHWRSRCPEGIFCRLSVPLTGMHPKLESITVATHNYLLEPKCIDLLDSVVDSLTSRPNVINLRNLISFREDVVKLSKNGVQDIRKTQQDDLVYKIRRWLYPENIAANTLSFLREARTSGTGTWFTQSLKFTSWLDDTSSSIFVLEGNPGTGKTYMSQLVYETLCARGNTVPLIHFIKHGVTSIEEVLRSLLIQTYQTTEDVSAEISHMHQTNQQPQRSGLVKALTDRLASLASSYIVLDALDELHVDDQPKLIAILRKLGSTVRLFIAARPLKDVYGTPPPQIYGISQSNDHDIQAFVSEWVDRDHIFLRSLGILRQSELRDEIRETVVLRSASLFLLASLHISRLSTCRALHDVREELASLPNTTEDRYKDTLARINSLHPRDRSRALAALQWIFYAKDRLTLPMLVHAVASLSLQEPFAQVGDYCIDGGLLLNICGGLLSVVREQVVFVHLTVNEFFREQESLVFPHDPHSSIASACIMYMLPSLSTLSSMNRSEWAPMLQGFMRYCLSNAEYHTLTAREKPKEHVLSAFFQHWAVYSDRQTCDFPRVSPLHWLVDVRWNPGQDHSPMSPATQLVQQLAQYYKSRDAERGVGDPLFEAVSRNRVDLVALLLKQPTVKPNAVSRRVFRLSESHSFEDRTPLTLAVDLKFVEIVKLLLDHPSVDSRLSKHSLIYGSLGVQETTYSPLALATEEGAIEIVNMLLSHPHMDQWSKSNTQVVRNDSSSKCFWNRYGPQSKPLKPYKGRRSHKWQPAPL